MAAETKWTPGPWRYDTRMADVRAPGNERIAVMVLGERKTVTPDGVLMAAAPDLYDTLASMLDRCTDGRPEAAAPTLAEWASEIMAVMAKARGERP